MTPRRTILQAAAIQTWVGCSGTALARPKLAETLETDVAHDRPPVETDERLSRLLAPIRDATRVPGLVGAVFASDRLAIAAVGIRKLGSPEPIQATDQMHPGSNTKAMTATLIGTLIEEGKLSWGSTIRDVFPAIAPQLHPEFQTATLYQLLTHRSGLVGNEIPDNEDDVRLLRGVETAIAKGGTPTEQRRVVLKMLMRVPPKAKPGSTFRYSNVGYALAGLMAEQVTGQPVETLMRQRLFEPLAMPSAGFGPPGRPGQVDQPWGHCPSPDQVMPTQEDYLVPYLAAAGTVHCSIPDWSRFAALHLAAARGRAKLLKQSTFRVLQTPPPGSGYACGWQVDSSAPSGPVLTHGGSNQAWFAFILLIPALNTAILTATNQGADAGPIAAYQALIAIARSSLDLPDDVFARP